MAEIMLMETTTATRPKRPSWLKVRAPGGANYDELKDLMRGLDGRDRMDCGGGTDTVDRSLVIGPDKADVFVDCEKSAS